MDLIAEFPGEQRLARPSPERQGKQTAVKTGIDRNCLLRNLCHVPRSYWETAVCIYATKNAADPVTYFLFAVTKEALESKTLQV